MSDSGFSPGPAAGIQQPDYDGLARRYLEIWRDEIAKMAHQPDGVAAWTALLQTMAQTAATAWGGVAATTSGATAGDARRPAATGENRAPATAVSPGGGSGDLADVLRRIDALERRIAALETSRKAGRRPRTAKR